MLMHERLCGAHVGCPGDIVKSGGGGRGAHECFTELQADQLHAN